MIITECLVRGFSSSANMIFGFWGHRTDKGYAVARTQFWSLGCLVRNYFGCVVLRLIAVVITVDSISHCAREGLTEWVFRRLAWSDKTETGFSVGHSRNSKPGVLEKLSWTWGTSDFLCVWVRVGSCLT